MTTPIYCSRHPKIELKWNFRTGEMTYCSACVEDREMEWGLENPERALEKWEGELEIAKANKRFGEVERIEKRIRTLKREK